MALENNRLRTDGKTIEPCCDDMESMIVFSYPDRYFDFNHEGKLHLKMSDGDCYPCNFCPSCGAKLEYVSKLED
jgi:hypothetical protein